MKKKEEHPEEYNENSSPNKVNEPLADYGTETEMTFSPPLTEEELEEAMSTEEFKEGWLKCIDEVFNRPSGMPSTKEERIAAIRQAGKEYKASRYGTSEEKECNASNRVSESLTDYGTETDMFYSPPLTEEELKETITGEELLEYVLDKIYKLPGK